MAVVPSADTFAVPISPIPVATPALLKEVRMSFGANEFAVVIWTLRTVFPVDTKLVLESIKSKTIPLAVFPEFLISVFGTNVLAIVFASVTNTEFAPTFSGALPRASIIEFATVTAGFVT